MKSLLVLTALLISTQAFSSEKVTCRSDKAIQAGYDKFLEVDAEISFTLNRETNVATNFVGHVFVKSQYEETEGISSENSYMGFFKTAKFEANSNYRPLTYKGWTQFKDVNAIHTAGQENGGGMWGDLVVDLRKEGKFEARYIFKAGDHMGGTVLFECRAQ